MQIDVDCLHTIAVIIGAVGQMRISPYPKHHRIDSPLYRGYVDIVVWSLLNQVTEQPAHVLLVPLVSGLTQIAVEGASLGLAPVGMPDGDKVAVLDRKPHIVVEQFKQFLAGGDAVACQNRVPALFEIGLLVIQHGSQHASLRLEVKSNQRLGDLGFLSHPFEGCIVQSLTRDAGNCRLYDSVLGFFASYSTFIGRFRDAHTCFFGSFRTVIKVGNVY